MNILIATGIYPPDAGGPASYSRLMANVLDSTMRYKTSVVCYSDASVCYSESKKDHRFSVPVYRISRSLWFPIRYALFAWKVFRAAKNADIVYLQGPVCEGLPGMIGAILARKPTVMKIVGDYAWEVYQGAGRRAQGAVLLDEFVTNPAVKKSLKIRVLEKIERWTARRAKGIIVPSAYLKSIVEKWDVPGSKVTVIENAIDPLPEESGKTRDVLREQCGVSSQRVLLTVVRAVPWKNADFIISLLPKLEKDIIFAIAGDGPSLDAWKRKVRELHVEDRVKFLGRLDRKSIADWYRAADLFVLPSGYEGFPHVIPEAASTGLHSFVSDQGGNPETKALLGEDFVTVLPYLDESAWLNALKAVWPERRFKSLPDALDMTLMINRTLDVLKQSV